MTERAEGFWWVRDLVGRRGHVAGDNDEWATCLLVGELLYWPGDEIGEDIDIQDGRYEWGPYLGKEPCAIGALLSAARSVLLELDARANPYSSPDPAPELRAALAAFPREGVLR